jgi:hypothetical protein
MNIYFAANTVIKLIMIFSTSFMYRKFTLFTDISTIRIIKPLLITEFTRKVTYWVIDK